MACFIHVTWWCSKMHAFEMAWCFGVKVVYSSYTPPKNNMTMEKTIVNEDVCPIKSGNFPAIAMLVHWRVDGNSIHPTITRNTYNYTPPNFNMKPENNSFQMDFPLPGTYFQNSVLNFQGCNPPFSPHPQESPYAWTIPSPMRPQCRQWPLPNRSPGQVKKVKK